MSTDEKTRDALSGAAIPQHVNPAEVVKNGSMLDIVFWVLALALLIGAIAASIILALVFLYATHQGKAFVSLLKDARIELRRVTWPTKPETISTTWQVLAVVVIMSLVLWGFDNLFGRLIQSIIG